MIRKLSFILFFLFLSIDFCISQAFIKTADLFPPQGDNSGKLYVIQSPSLDTLLSRYIMSRRKITTIEGTQGIDGFRIQIYYSSVRTAREESAKTRAEFINKFPDIVSYAQYAEPGYFMVRAGDYRTKTEGFKHLLMIRKEFPDAYLVPAVINYPDLNRK